VDVDAVLGGLFELIAPHMTEKQRRLLAGAGARALGRGGGARMARISGRSRPTVYAGVRELEDPPDPGGRIRRPGGGPKRRTTTDPGLLAALDALVEPVNSSRFLGQIRGLSGHAAGADCAAW
jgi:hypothetical protein